MVVTEPPPPPRAARVSSASMPAIPDQGTAIVEWLTVARPPDAVAASARSKPEGKQAELVLAERHHGRGQAVPATPRRGVTKASPISRGTTDDSDADRVIGRRSGLTAIAPTIKIAFSSTTP